LPPQRTAACRSRHTAARRSFTHLYRRLQRHEQLAWLPHRKLLRWSAMYSRCHSHLQARTSAPYRCLSKDKFMNRFERYLTVWVGLCIVAGIIRGNLSPAIFQTIARMEIAQVNLPVGLLIWVMIIPMLVKIDFSALSQVKTHWRGIGVTLVIN